MSLPPLPASDKESLIKNEFNQFYKTTPRKFWKDNYIESKKSLESSKCKHFFIERNDGFICKKCNIGFQGFGLKLSKGHLFFENQKII